MTPRELTSGFDCSSRGHLRMAMSHHPTIFGADIFIQSGVVDIFPKLKIAAAAILDKLCEFGTFCHVSSEAIVSRQATPQAQVVYQI